MKIWPIALSIIVLLALLVSAVNFDPGGDIDMKNRWDINNGGNASFQRVGIINPPAACPAGNYMTFYNGSTALCSTPSASTGSSTYLNVINYGLVGNGATDNTAAFQTLINSVSTIGGTFYFPNGTYIFNSSVAFNSTSTTVKYRVTGDGGSSRLKASYTTQGTFMFYNNENTDGTKIASYPGHTRLSFDNVYIDGSGATNTSFIKNDETSVVLRDMTILNMFWGIYSVNYADNIGLYNIRWSAPRASGWLFKNTGNGDSFEAYQIFTEDYNTIWLSSTAGAHITAVNGGHMKFSHTHNAVIEGGHFEYSNENDPSISIRGASVSLISNYFMKRNGINNFPHIIIEDNGTSSYGEKSDVFLTQNSFVEYIDTYNTTRNTDIIIRPDTYYTRVVFEANQGYTQFSGRAVWAKVGFIVRSNTSAVDAMLLRNKDVLFKNAELSYIDGAYLLRPYGDGGTTFGVYNRSTPWASYTGAQTSATFWGDIPSGKNYFYKYATMTCDGRITNYASFNQSTTARSSIQMGLGTLYAPSILRIWRNTTAGAAVTGYVDIPINEPNVEIYDQGTHIAGYPWIAASIPAIPTATNTTTGTCSAV